MIPQPRLQVFRVGGRHLFSTCPGRFMGLADRVDPRHKNLPRASGTLPEQALLQASVALDLLERPMQSRALTVAGLISSSALPRWPTPRPRAEPRDPRSRPPS